MQGDLRLVDCEDGDVAEVTVSGPLLSATSRRWPRSSSRPGEFCTRRGMVYLLARNEVPVEQLITGYLATRGLVR